MNMIYKTAVVIGIGALLAGLMLISAMISKADGYKDIPEHTYYRERYNTRVNYRGYVDAEDMRTLRRIKARAEMWMVMRHNVRARRYNAQDMTPKRIRYAKSSRYDSELVDQRSGRRECQAPISVEGEERGSDNRARGNARDTWKRVTISRFGYRYADVENARNASYACVKLRNNKFGWPIYSCGFTARPCRDM